MKQETQSRIARLSFKERRDILRVFGSVGRDVIAECVRASRRPGGLEALLFTDEEIESGATRFYRLLP